MEEEFKDNQINVIFHLIIRQKLFTANYGNQKNNPTIDINNQNENN